jgi:polyphosphate glucokinase
MKVLAIDVGGTHIKVLATGRTKHRKFASGSTLEPAMMVAGVKDAAKGWQYDVVSIGYPGPVRNNRPVAEPHNLGKGWVGFDFQAAFKCPVKIINDAAMQALGSYQRGRMLFLGLGTGLGTAMIADGVIMPMELGHLPYKAGVYEDYIGIRGLEKNGKKKWRKEVEEVIAQFVAALQPDEVVIGGGNVNKLKALPRGCRQGDNTNAFLGGFRLWKRAQAKPAAAVAGRMDGKVGKKRSGVSRKSKGA